MKLNIQFLIPLLLLLTISPLQAQTTNLAVAASMTDAVKQIITDFLQTHPGADLRPNFASSGSLAKQIAQGAPADIYISANPGWMTYLKENHLIVTGTDRIFAFNTLVFISEKAYSNLSINGLVNFQRIAIGSPKSTPAGKYAEQAMENAGVYAHLQKAKKLILAKDVRQALLYADQGEVDGAFVYKTDALLAHHAKIAFTVPEKLYSRVSYPVALTVNGADNAMAKAFYNFMSSAEATAVLTKFGFEPNRVSNLKKSEKR